MAKTTGNSIRCSFCGRPQEAVKKIIAGPSGVFICDECVAVCQSIMETENFEEYDDNDVSTNIPNPAEIKKIFAPISEEKRRFCGFWKRFLIF